MNVSSLWVLAPDALLVGLGLACLGVGALATATAPEFINRSASGRSAARPGAGSDVDPSTPRDIPSSRGVGGWAAEAKDPQPPTPGGPTP